MSRSSLASAGPNTAVYSQKYIVLEESGVQSPEPRNRYLEQLMRVINDLKIKSHMILINLDANEDISIGTALQAFSEEHLLTNLIADFSPSQTNTSTYKRVVKRLDYSFCCSNFLPFVTSANISHASEVKESDHRTLVLYFV